MIYISSGQATSLVREACAQSPVGKLLPDDLYVHKSAEDRLSPLVRLHHSFDQQAAESFYCDVFSCPYRFVLGWAFAGILSHARLSVFGRKLEFCPRSLQLFH